jgi:hypothetical protein
MRTCFLCALILLVGFSAQAQTEKGKMFIGGQVSLSGNNGTDSDTLNSSTSDYFQIEIIPGYGYFIRDNFALGADINFLYANDIRNYTYPHQIPSEQTMKATRLGIGGDIFARYYAKIVAGLYFTATAQAGYRHQSTTNERSNNDASYVYPPEYPAKQTISSNKFSISVVPGLAYFITPKIGIHCSFGNLYYSYSASENISLSNGNKSHSNNYGVNLNLSTLYFGLSYYF